jgi:hypothetical protein
VISNEIKDVFRRQVQVSLPGVPFTLTANVLWQAVARATAASLHRLRLPAGDVQIPAGFIPVLGTICYDNA